MAKNNIKHLDNMYSVDILSADEMGRIITTGNNTFDFGILIPQNIMLGGHPIPFDSSIDLIKNILSKGKKIQVKPLCIIEKQNTKFARRKLE